MSDFTSTTLDGSATSPFVLQETVLWLCGIPSPIGEEAAICDAVAARLQRLPLADKIRRYGDSLVVPVIRTREPGRPHVALVGHLDTVRTENGKPRLEGRRVFGAGAADMKSGLAVMIVLAETMKQITTGADVTLVFYAREEGPYLENELGRVLEEDDDLGTVDLAVCLEPSDNKLHVGCCGAIHATVTFEGRTAHSARPWEGENAIHKASGLLARLAALPPREHVIGGHTYRTVTSATLANGGRSRNVVPDTFTVNLNHRFAPDTSMENAKAEILALVDGEGSVTFTDLSPPAMPWADSPLVQKLIGSGVKGVEPKQAWTDVGRFAQAGIRAVNFGPGENAQAHQKNESTDMGLVHDGLKILRTWLASL